MFSTFRDGAISSIHYSIQICLILFEAYNVQRWYSLKFIQAMTKSAKPLSLQAWDMEYKNESL